MTTTKAKTLDIDWTRLNTGDVTWSLRWQRCYLELGYTREYFLFALGFIGHSFFEYTRDEDQVIYGKIVENEALISEAARSAGIRRWPVDPWHDQYTTISFKPNPDDL